MSSPAGLLASLCIYIAFQYRLIAIIYCLLTMCQSLCQAFCVSYLIYSFQQPSKLGAIIVLILLRVEVSHRDELWSSFRVHGPLVSVLCLLYCTAFQRQVWKLRDQIQTGFLGYKMT